MSDMVYTSPTGSVYHTDPACHSLDQIEDPNEHPHKSMEGFWSECKHCQKEAPDRKEYNWSLADPGPKLDGAILSPKDSEDNVRIGKVWTRDGFEQV